jgi:hypothetical protein
VEWRDLLFCCQSALRDGSRSNGQHENVNHLQDRTALALNTILLKLPIVEWTPMDTAPQPFLLRRLGYTRTLREIDDKGTAVVRCRWERTVTKAPWGSTLFAFECRCVERLPCGLALEYNSYDFEWRTRSEGQRVGTDWIGLHYLPTGRRRPLL